MELETAMDAWVRALDRPSRKAFYTVALKDVMDA